MHSHWRRTPRTKDPHAKRTQKLGLMRNNRKRRWSPKSNHDQRPERPNERPLTTIWKLSTWFKLLLQGSRAEKILPRSVKGPCQWRTTESTPTEMKTQESLHQWSENMAPEEIANARSPKKTIVIHIRPKRQTMSGDRWRTKRDLNLGKTKPMIREGWGYDEQLIWWIRSKEQSKTCVKRRDPNSNQNGWTEYRKTIAGQIGLVKD